MDSRFAGMTPVYSIGRSFLPTIPPLAARCRFFDETEIAPQRRPCAEVAAFRQWILSEMHIQ
jgi:hypothetical protein